jgi:hypothetical protein
LLSGLVELADVLGASFFLLENVPDLLRKDHALAPAGEGRHCLFSNLRREAEARLFSILATPIFNDAACGGMTSRDRVAVLGVRQELMVLLPPLDLEDLLRPENPGSIRSALSPPEDVDRPLLEVQGTFQQGLPFKGKAGAVIVGTLRHGASVEVGHEVALQGAPHPTDKGCPQQWDARVTWLRVASILGSYRFGEDSRVLLFEQGQTPVPVSEVKAVRLSSPTQRDGISPGTLVVLARKPSSFKKNPPLLWVVRAVERVGRKLCLSLLSALNRDSFVTQCDSSDVLAIVPSAIPVYDIDSIGITIRTFGAQPQKGSFLIWDSRLDACVRRLSGLEQWQLHGLGVPARQALAQAGVATEQLGRYAANSITAAMARRFAELLAKLAAFTDAVWEGSSPSGWLSPFAPVPQGLHWKRATLVVFCQAKGTPEAAKFEADPLVWAHPSGQLLPGVNFQQEGRAHKLAKTKVHALLQSMAADSLPEEVETLLASNLLTKVGPKEDSKAIVDLHVFTVVMGAQEMAKAPGCWLPLSSLRLSRLFDLVEQAYTELATFMAPVAAGEPLGEWHSSSGALQEGWVKRTQSVLDFSAKSGAFQPLPLRTQHEAMGISSAAWEEALLHCNKVHEQLRLQLEAAGLPEWAQAVKPVPRQLLPSSLHLEASLEPVPGSEKHLFCNRTPTFPTDPVPPTPPQPQPPVGFKPKGIGDLLTAKAVEGLISWVKRQCAVLVQIRETGDATDRKGLLPFVLGQQDFVEEARGIVWDLRQAAEGVVEPLDFTAIPSTHLNREFLMEQIELLRWPDLQLRDFLKYGVSYLAPKALQVVLQPHLISIKEGYLQFLEDMRSLEDLGWFGLFDSIPFLPINLIPRGSAPKSDGTWRPTTDGGCPRPSPLRPPLADSSGEVVVPLNEACLEQATAEDAPLDPDSNPKWPPEGKPRFADTMDFVTALHNLALELGWEIFAGSEDMKKWFNQFHTRREEHWKTCALFEEDGLPKWYYEAVMTFGLRPASNIAQRGANLIMAILAKEMARSDEVEIPKLREQFPALDQWFSSREVLQARLATVKEVFAEYREDPCNAAIPFKAYMAQPLRQRGFSPENVRFFAQLKEIEQVTIYAEVQARLWIVPVYTDDNFMGALGLPVFTRLMATWDEVAGKIGLLNSPAKRQIGCHLTWIGAGMLLTARVAYIPAKKAIKAGERLQLALDGSLPREAYRSLVGLLEHFVYILMKDRSYMHDLYRPFGWSSFQDPQDTFEPKGLLRRNLFHWQKLLLTECGASMLRVFNKAGVLKGSTPVFHVSSDAAKEGAKVPGLGGFFHGYWVCLPLSQRQLEMPIAVLEAAAFLLTFWMVDEILPEMPTVPDEELPRLLFGVDALATAFVSTREKTTKAGMVTFLAALKASKAWERRAPQAYLAHVFGERNLAADAASRGERDRLNRLCKMLHLTPKEQALPKGFRQFMVELEEAVLGPLEQNLAPAPTKESAPQIRAPSDVEMALDISVANTHDSASFLALHYHIVTRAVFHEADDMLFWEFNNPVPDGHSPPKSLQELALEAQSPALIKNLLEGCRDLPGDYYMVAEGPVFRLGAPLPGGTFQPGIDNQLLELRRRSPEDVVVPDALAHPLIETWITAQAHVACEMHGVRFFICELADTDGIPYRLHGRTRSRQDGSGKKRDPPDDKGGRRVRRRKCGKRRMACPPPSEVIIIEEVRTLTLAEQHLDMGMANMPSSASFIASSLRFLMMEGRGSHVVGRSTKVWLRAEGGVRKGARPLFGANSQGTPLAPSKASAVLRRAAKLRESTSSGKSRERALNAVMNPSAGPPCESTKPRLGPSPPVPVSLRDGSLAHQAWRLNNRNPNKRRGFIRDLQERAVADARVAVQSVQARGSHLSIGASGGRLDGLLDTVEEFTRLGEGAKSYGTYDSHWRRWVSFCKEWGTSEWRDSHAANCGQDREGYSNEVILMSLALLTALTEIRGKKGGPCKPNTARAFLRSVRKVHSMRGITMVPISAVQAVFKGAMARHIKLYGADSLLPDTKQPFHKRHIHLLADLADGTKLGSRTYRKSLTWCRSWDAYVATSAATGFRKAEVAFTHVESTPITRGAVSWIIQGVAVPRLTQHQLLGLKEGDYVVLKPPPSKADPFALVWGNRPIYGAFLPHQKANMARAIRDLFVHVHVPEESWASTPLFVDDGLQPFTGSFIDTTLRAALRSLGLSAAEAAKYSPHSFRIYLACALKSAGKSDAEIQMLCRWQSVDSLRLYARIDARQYAELVQAAHAADSRAISVSSLPILDVHQLHPALKDLVGGAGGAPAPQFDDVDLDIIAAYDDENY